MMAANNYYNAEGYADPTAYRAIKHLTKRPYIPKRAHKAVLLVRGTLEMMGYELTSIQIRERSGETYNWWED